MTSSSVGTLEENEDCPFELDDLIVVPEQTLDEILADRVLAWDEEQENGEDEERLSEEEEEWPSRDGDEMTTVIYRLPNPIRVDQINGIAQHLSQNRSRIGASTALALSESCLAIGTSKGFVLIFERGKEEHLIASLDGGERCSIAALDFSPDNASRLAVGYSRGLVQVFHVSSAQLLDHTDSAQQPGAGILHLLFAHRRSVILVDSGGSVFDLRLRSRLRQRRIRCIFSGCHGEVVHVTLINGTGEGILVMTSLTKLFLISMLRRRIIFTAPLLGPANAPPLVTWRNVTVKTGEYSMEQPMLCIGRGSQLQILHLHSSDNGGYRIVRMKSITIPSVCPIGLHWISSNALILLDETESLRLIDMNGNQMASVDCAFVQLVYASADFKGLSTGGKVSPALECLSERVCYQSTRSRGDVLFLLGACSLFRVHVAGSMDQLNILLQQNDIISACQYFVDSCLRNRTRRQTRKKPLSTTAVKKQLSTTVAVDEMDSENVGVELVSRLMQMAMTGPQNGHIKDLIEHYKQSFDVLLRVCECIKRMDLVYEDGWTAASRDPLARAIFLDLLDGPVLNDGDQLNDAPPALLSEYLQNLVQEGSFAQFEAAVVHLPIDRIDIHQVMTVCRKHELYDGIIYVMNRAMLDFISPLEEMLQAVSTMMEREVQSDTEIALGNKLLLYLSCLLCGRAYPFGALPVDKQESVPQQVYRCLVSVHGRDGSQGGAQYPNVRVLIRFDAKQFFHLICTCSDAPLEERLQRLLSIAHQSIASTNRLELSLLLDCVAHLVFKDCIVANINQLNEMIERFLLSSIPNNGIPPSMLSSEKTIVELLRMYPQLDATRILQLAERLQSVPICTAIYLQHRCFGKLLRCYLQGDTLYTEEIFAVIESLLVELIGEEKAEVERFVEANLMKLNRLDSNRTAQLILLRFPHFTIEICRLPESRDTCQLARAIIRARGITGYSTTNEEMDERLLSLACRDVLNNGDGEEELTTLLRQWLRLASRSDLILNWTVSQSQGLISASVLLLEARQLATRAVEMLFERLQLAIDKMGDSPEWTKAILDLCTRHPLEQSEGRWLRRLFDLLLGLPEHQLRYDTAVNEMLSSVISALLDSGSGAETVLERLFDQSAFRGANCSQYRALINTVLASLNYDQVLLENTLGAIGWECMVTLRQLITATTQPISSCVTALSCAVCHDPFISTSALLHPCAHLRHVHCLPLQSPCPCPISPPSMIIPYVSERSREKKKNLFDPVHFPLRLASSSSSRFD